MGSIFIQNFKFGMDRRRERMAGVPGTLWLGKNIHVTRGGDIERCKDFQRTHTLPTSLTFGLAAVRGQLYTFGSGATPAGLPAEVQYQRLQAGDSSAMVEVLDVRTFDGKLYVVARYAGGPICHFYNGTRVTALETLADSASTYTTLADYFAEIINADSDVIARASGTTFTLTAREPGTAFTLDTATVDNGANNDQVADVDTLQANVEAVEEVRATGTITIAGGTAGALNKITSVEIDSTELISAAVSWVTSHSATAAALAQAINNGTATHGYSASSLNAIVTVSAPIGDGATANGDAIGVTSTGNVVTSTTPMASGVTAVEAVAQIMRVSFGGTFQANDQFTITINNRDYVATGRASAMGVSAFVYKKRVWTPANSLWRYCKLNDPTDWTNADPASGAGFINVSSDSEGTERLVGAAAYGTQLAVASRRNIWIYNIGTDAEEFSLAQTIENSGSRSARAMIGYGNLDVFYLDDSGMRSLKSKELSSDAYADDVGAAVEPFLLEYLDTLTNGQVARAVATMEPRDRRYWLAVGNRIFVYSNFPRSQIAAWTYYEPEFEISDIARAYNQIYVRSGDFIYGFGGADGTEYPDAETMIPVAELPFVAAPTPTPLNLTGFDLGATGSWTVELLVDPDNEASTMAVGTLTGCTFPDGDITVPGRTTHVGVKLTGVGAGQMSVSNLAIYHDGKEPNI